MKPVILSFVLLLGVMLTYVWLDKVFVKRNEKVLYFEPQTTVGVGNTVEINLMVNYMAPVTGYNLEFLYDPTVVKIEGIVVNNNIFDKVMINNIDQYAGKISIRANSSAEVSGIKVGIQKLATIILRGVNKGDVNIIRGEKKKVTVFENGKLMESDFTIKAFKVEVK